jgi:glyoxylase-like metal-dependent hydrolase (beta-lactamase superfamily II)
MQLYSIETGRFRLDGGAMFGVVPREIWQRTNPPNERNRIDMAMRCLLIQTENRLILVDNGLGHKYDAKFAGLYEVDHSTTLDASLRARGFDRSQITDVILTHLHFDHCGGTTERDPATGLLRVAFPNAQIWIQRNHWEWAAKPNPREKASFFAENLEPISASGQLNLLEGETEFLPGLKLILTNGHTEAMQHPVIEFKGRKILFASDFMPSFGHAPLPYIMAYDVRPLVSMEERAKLYEWLVNEQVVIMYQHDPQNECGLLERNDKGGYRSGSTFPLSDLTS